MRNGRNSLEDLLAVVSLSTAVGYPGIVFLFHLAGKIVSGNLDQGTFSSRGDFDGDGLRD